MTHANVVARCGLTRFEYARAPRDAQEREAAAIVRGGESEEGGGGGKGAGTNLNPNRKP